MVAVRSAVVDLDAAPAGAGAAPAGGWRWVLERRAHRTARAVGAGDGLRPSVLRA